MSVSGGEGVALAPTSGEHRPEADLEKPAGGVRGEVPGMANDPSTSEDPGGSSLPPSETRDPRPS